jgi:hypothetical protein
VKQEENCLQCAIQNIIFKSTDLELVLQHVQKYELQVRNNVYKFSLWAVFIMYMSKLLLETISAKN